jgi:hypothetical protein
MMTRREMNAALSAPFVALLSAAVASLGAAAASPGQDGADGKPLSAPPQIPTLIEQPIGDLGDAEASMLILNLPPRPAPSPNEQTRRSFPAHKHSGPVFAYVLEGSVENQVDPEDPRTYHAGDVWYEPAMHVHRLLRNLSDTQPARILVFQVLPKGQPAAYSAP